ncbi:MAG: Verru_Chthon cassette protein D [Verrucomicrobiota bacterium]
MSAGNSLDDRGASHGLRGPAGKPPIKNPIPAAFTLIELLVVMAIIGIMAALIVPAFTGILGGSRLSMATENVLGAFASARQLATAKNREIEVRLLVFKNPDSPSSSSQIRGIQLAQVEESGLLKNIEKPRIFPAGIICGNSAAMSSLASGTIPPTTATNGDPSISGVGINYTYYRFRVRPDGSFNLSNLGLPNTVTNYYLTLYSENFQPSGNTPPANFATIQIEPATGDATLYRP